MFRNLKLLKKESQNSDQYSEKLTEAQKWLEVHCSNKIMGSEDAMTLIKRGSRVFIGTGCGEPQHLIRAMVNDMNKQDMIVYQMLSSTFSEFVDDETFLNRFLLKLFFISQDMREAAFEGKIDYIPAYLSQIPDLFSSHRIGLDAALIQVSPPGKFGYCSLGVSVDITKSGMEKSPLVIAQVNPRMPRTWGDSFVHVDDIDAFVLHEEPLVEGLREVKDNEVARRIGHYVSQLVNDGDTIQVGFGQLPYAILKYLDKKQDLGVHTQMITDGFIPLFEKNVITNKKKKLLPGRVVASMCVGSEKIYEYVDDNPMFYFRSSEFVNDPLVIARNNNLVSISSALEVDLTGQVCSDSVGYRFYSGIGDQVDFLRGSAMSKGGFSIIALPSATADGKKSRIVPHLSEGAGVATTRGDVNFVVTEYGIAELQGKSIQQRVMELAQIAHPNFRNEIIQVGKKRHYIFADQLPPSQDDLLFLEKYKSCKQTPTDEMVEYRPLLPSDEFDCRNFFYSLNEKTIFYRYFYKMKVFSHEIVQKQWAAVDYRRSMSIVGLHQKGDHKDIVAIGSYAEVDQECAEVAFVVSEEFQNMGIASYLIKLLEEIAWENNYKRFTASVLRENNAMIHVFKKRYPDIKIEKSGNSEVELFMDLKKPNMALDKDVCAT